MTSRVQMLCIKQENGYLSENRIAYQIDKSGFYPQYSLHKANIWMFWARTEPWSGPRCNYRFNSQ